MGIMYKPVLSAGSGLVEKSMTRVPNFVVAAPPAGVRPMTGPAVRNAPIA
jgi:hypothetical protein